VPNMKTAMLGFLKAKRRPTRDLDTTPVQPPAPRSERYLTDGVELYRMLGAMARGAWELLAVENCRSLEICLIPLTELRRGRLRFVTVDSDEAPQLVGMLT
jgi:hypothetical protein